MGARRGVLTRTYVPVGLCALTTLLLSSCAFLPQEATTETPEDSKVTSQVESVMVVAGVDLDGKNVTVSGYVAGVVEDDGTCTFTLEHDSSSVSVSTTGRADRSTTTCGSAQVPTEDLERGTWTASLTYSSSTTRSEPSAVLSLEVP